MANDEVLQRIRENLSSLGASVPSFSSPVTVRLDASVLRRYEVLSRHLGFSSRSALMRAVLEGSVSDLVETASEVLSARGDSLDELFCELDGHDDC